MLLARVAELVDALGSGSSGGNPVKVQVLSRAKEEAIRKDRLFLWGSRERA